MALRRVTRRFDDLSTWLEERASILDQGAVLLPADQVEGELAPQLKLDLLLPLLGRVGPITAQVVHTASDGSVALRLPRLQEEVGERLGELDAAVEDLRAWLSTQDTGATPGSDERVVELEALNARLRKELEEALAALDELEELLEGHDLDAPRQSARKASRGFQVPDVSKQSPTLQGDLADRTLRDAMVQLSINRVTGLLTIRESSGVVRYGFWSKGGPVGWRTDPVQEGEVLGVLLYKAQQLTKEQLQRSLELMEESGQRQGEALIEMNVLTYPQLIMVLGKQVEFLLQRAMQQREGTWTFHVLPSLPERFLPAPLAVPALLYRALLQHLGRLPAEEVVGRVTPLLDQYVEVFEEFKPMLVEMKFNKVEVKLMNVLQSTSWRLREFFGVSPLSRAKTTATILALDELGFLAFQGQENRARYLERMTSLIRRKRLQASKASLFDMLEVHWICLPQEVEQNYRRLVGEFDPARFKDLPPELEADLLLVNERIREAYARLKDDRTRREYRKELIEEEMIYQSAELLGKKGEMAIMRQDRRDAAACFGKALELMPRSMEFREGLQRAATLG